MNLFQQFLRLGAIVGAMPNQITDGTLIDAVPVMANFQWIIDQVNANAASTGYVNTQIAEAVGTPFYCYSTATLERH